MELLRLSPQTSIDDGLRILFYNHMHFNQVYDATP